VKVAIIGLDTTDVKRLLGEEMIKGLDFEAPEKTMNKYLPEVKEKGADLVIVLSHLGFEEDKKLAQAVPGIDFIVGGHTHTELPQGHKEGDTFIVQAGSNSKYVGNLEISLDPASKKIVGSSASLIPITSDQVKPDPEIQNILKPYIEEANKIGSRLWARRKKTCISSTRPRGS